MKKAIGLLAKRIIQRVDKFIKKQPKINFPSVICHKQSVFFFFFPRQKLQRIENKVRLYSIRQSKRTYVCCLIQKLKYPVPKFAPASLHSPKSILMQSWKRKSRKKKKNRTWWFSCSTRSRREKIVEVISSHRSNDRGFQSPTRQYKNTGLCSPSIIKARYPVIFFRVFSSPTLIFLVRLQ